KGTEHSEETETLLAQLDAISDVRNKFVHQLVEYDSTVGFRVTNELTVRSADNVQNHTYTAGQLKDMENDCNRIFYRFGLLCNKLEETWLVAKKDVTLSGYLAHGSINLLKCVAQRYVPSSHDQTSISVRVR